MMDKKIDYDELAEKIANKVINNLFYKLNTEQLVVPESVITSIIPIIQAIISKIDKKKLPDIIPSDLIDKIFDELIKRIPDIISAAEPVLKNIFKEIIFDSIKNMDEETIQKLVVILSNVIELLFIKFLNNLIIDIKSMFLLKFVKILLKKGDYFDGPKYI